MRVGMAMDQPTTPNIPSPNQIVWSFAVLPLSLRASFVQMSFVKASARFCRLSLGVSCSSLIFPQFHEAAQKIDFQLRSSGAGLLFAFIQFPELLHDFQLELSELRSPYGISHGHEDFIAFFVVGAHVDGRVVLVFRSL